MSYPKNLGTKLNYLTNYSTNSVKLNMDNSITELTNISSGARMQFTLPPNSLVGKLQKKRIWSATRRTLPYSCRTIPQITITPLYEAPYRFMRRLNVRRRSENRLMSKILPLCADHLTDLNTASLLRNFSPALVSGNCHLTLKETTLCEVPASCPMETMETPRC